MKDVIAGHGRFRATVYAAKKDLFEKLGNGQAPRALFISCSDSRVDPELLTGMDPGQLFVIRNAGNIVPAHRADVGGSVSAAIEYAMTALQVPNVIVCGHSGCGAMKAVLHPEDLGGLPEVAGWISHAAAARATLDAEEAERGENERLGRCVELNVLAQIDNLVTHPSVAARVARRDVRIYGWVFDIPTGEVRAYDPSTHHFEKLSERSIEAVIPPRALD